MLRKIIVIFFITFFFTYQLFSHVHAQQNLSVTARVPPTTEDVILSITRSPTGLIQENQEVTFTIQYRSTADVSWPVVLKTSWYPGHIQGTSTQVDVWNYDIGSATSTDENIDPTVDLLNNEITWSIPSLVPSSSFHTVSFRLKSKDPLPTTQVITTDVKAGGTIGPSVLTNQGTTVVLHSFPTPTPTPSLTPTQSASSTTSETKPTPAYTPTPTLRPIPFDFVSISQPTIENSRTLIRFSTSKDSVFTVSYGTSASLLTKKASGVQFRTIHEVELPSLTEKTQYYFRINATSNTGEKIESDLFTFTTSSTANQITTGKNGVNITWNNILLHQGQDTTSNQTLLVPSGQLLTVNINIDNPQEVKQIKAKIQNEDILGIFDAFAQITAVDPDEVELYEVLPGVFSGQLKTPNVSGNYKIIFTLQDISGGITTSTLKEKIKISAPLMVTDENNHPIEGALVKILRIKSKKSYSTPIQYKFSLPLYTDIYGKLDLVLPVGQYKVEVSAPGYESKDHTFTLSPENGYPVIHLKSSNNTSGLIAYYGSNLKDLFIINTAYVNSILPSERALNSVVLIFYIVLIIGSLNVLSRKHSLSLFEFIYFSIERYLYKADLLFHLTKPALFIHVFEKNKIYGLSGVTVAVTNKKNNIVLRVKTNMFGEAKIPFDLMKATASPLFLKLERKGYKSYTTTLIDKKIPSKTTTIYMEKEPANPTPWAYVTITFDYFFISLFYCFSFIGIIITILSIFYRGFFSSWIFILTSILMSFIWYYYVKYTFLQPETRDQMP